MQETRFPLGGTEAPRSWICLKKPENEIRNAKTPKDN